MKKFVYLLTTALMLAGCTPSESPNEPKPGTVRAVGVKISSPTLILWSGETKTLTATVAPTKAENQSVTWSSDNESIATVSAVGEVTGVGGGSATITVTTEDGGFTALCLVTVNIRLIPVTQIGLTAENAARFDEYIDELLAEYPEGTIGLNAGDHEVEITMENLAKLWCEHIPTDDARIVVIDNKLRIAKIQSENIEWGVGPGTSRLAEWTWLSQLNGTAPVLTLLYNANIDLSVIPGIKISEEFVAPENLVSEPIYGGDNATVPTLMGDFIMLDIHVLPVGIELYIKYPGLTNKFAFRLDADRYAIDAASTKELDEQLIQNYNGEPYGDGPIGSMPPADTTLNYRTCMEYLRSLGVTFSWLAETPAGSGRSRALYVYCSFERENKLKLVGKVPIGLPAWAASLAQ